jgi:hypothetical protein
MSAGSWRTTPLPSGWGRLRVQVLARDPVCRWGMLPGETGPCHQDATDADHMGAPDDHRLEMMRGLCHPHHKKRSDEQGRAAKEALRSLRFLPKEPHPGFVRKGDALLCLRQCHSCLSRSTARRAMARRHARLVRARARSIRTSARLVMARVPCRTTGSRETDPSRPTIKAIHPTREVAQQRDEPE